MKLWKSFLILTFAAITLASAQDDEPAIPPRGGEGTINIDIQPVGSTVYLDAEEIGKSPIKDLKFRSGRHDLLVIDQEQELISTRFNVWPDSLNTFKGKTVMPFGNIEVTTNPGRCNIFLDGEQADYTNNGPLMLKNLDAGDHVIKAKCRGFRAKEALVNVPGEQTVKVHINARKR
jgi:hypothetical protein